MNDRMSKELKVVMVKQLKQLNCLEIHVPEGKFPLREEELVERRRRRDNEQRQKMKQYHRMAQSL
jgi:hypothetical protein